MAFLLNPALAAGAAALLLSLGGCKPVSDGPDARDRAEPVAQRTSTGTAPRQAERPAGADGDEADPRTSTMGAASSAALPPAVPGALPPPAGGRAPDPQITAGVRAQLAADAELRTVRIDVDTRDGIVTLSGSVPTAAMRARAGEIAHAVRGVRRVNDQLTLASG
ncbi:BON domain-containing protein [Ramlibacter tataouinensis]|uniref:BON domain-containing protein n=1 Tax=Ramlibacter tataouinensis TaxID=94132 RepID=UPI0022F3BBED|nr:BON domain-containing protein [Ramlibacter tataouinensis]WBY03388.1 BON domain-containing protein [Ramlibacter tataouinensis]